VAGAVRGELFAEKDGTSVTEIREVAVLMARIGLSDRVGAGGDRVAGEDGGAVIFTPLAAVKHYGSTSKVSRFWVEWQKGKGLDLYFRKFATTPLEHALAFVFSPVIRVALMARILVLSVQMNRRAANMKRLRAIAGERRAGEDPVSSPTENFA
jgi:hypothetical protein